MKKTIQLVSFLLMLSFAFTACNDGPKAEAQEEPIDMEALRTEIQAMEDAFAAAEKAKDADAVAAYYSEDAVSYSRNQPPASGRATIREKIAEGFASDTLGGSNVYKVVDLFAEGDMAVEIGSWTQLDSTGTQTDSGYYMSYFEKRDGKYQCVRDMSVINKAEDKEPTASLQ